MDGQRRIAGSMKKRAAKTGLLAIGDNLRLRIAVRAGGVLFLGASILHGAVYGGHLDYPGSPFVKMPGKIASFVGLAADDVRISGLVHHEPEQVLSEIGLKLGGSLLGFDAKKAREKLRSLDWVASVEIQREFPNRIEITLVEREPYAVWQINGEYKVIGRDGVPMSGLSLAMLSQLPLVTGVGANTAAFDYVNEMSAMPELMMRVHAASRVGERRWNLYLDNGVKIALPETGISAALQKVAELDASQGILSKGIRGLDFRRSGTLVVELAEAQIVEAGKTPKVVTR